MRRRKLFLVALTVIGILFMGSLCFAVAPFYEGKTIRLIVAGSPGGGYDTYARAIARHMSKYLPGKPAIIVENMAGAGGMIAANNAYKVAKPDGLTICSFLGGLLLSQVLDQPGIQYDVRKFEFLGAPAKDTVVFLLTKASGITTLEKWKSTKTPVKLGGVSLGAHAPDNVTKVVQKVLGFPIQLVSGYKGTAEIKLAVQSGELSGCGLGWESARVTWRQPMEAGEVVPLLQAAQKPLPDLPNLPLVAALAKNDEERKLIQAGIHDPTLTARPYGLPPGTPRDRVNLLRHAFQDTLKDKDFLADTDKAKLGIDPVTGEELEKTVAGIFSLDPGTVTKLKEILLK